MILQLASFFLFSGVVGIAAWLIVRKSPIYNSEDYFLGGRSLTGIVIAGSLLLTNISTEHLVGMNGSAYKNGAIIIAWEVTSALALVVGAVYFAPRYLKMGISTIPEFLENRFDSLTRTLIAALLITSFVCTLLPIVLYTGALNIESIFNVSKTLNVERFEAILLIILIVGFLGSLYAVWGGLKMIAVTDTINGIGLLALGLFIPLAALYKIGEGNILGGLGVLYEFAPEKFNVRSPEPSLGEGARGAILPFSVLFTGLVVNQLYFWTMHQSIIQRVLGAVSLKEAQKGLLITGGLKILIPLIVVLPGIIAYYYFGQSLYDNPDDVYPRLVKMVLPFWLTGFFIAVLMGAVFSTFNSVLNSAATVFSLDIYKKYFKPNADDRSIFRIGRNTTLILAIASMALAPFIGYAPQGLYQLLQQLNGIFFIPMASVIIAGFLFPKVSACGARAGLLFGLIFYIVCYFILKLPIHFVHIWGIEFVLNLLVMHLVSVRYPNANPFSIRDVGVVDVAWWRWTKFVSIILIGITVSVYVIFGWLI